MRIHRRTAVAVSGLVFGGTAALLAGPATSASAGTVSSVPQVTAGTAAYGCHGRSCRRGRGSHHSSAQKVYVVNHNTNISRSSSNQFQDEGNFRNRRHGFGRGCGHDFGCFGDDDGFDGFGGWGWDDDDWD